MAEYHTVLCATRYVTDIPFEYQQGSSKQANVTCPL